MSRRSAGASMSATVSACRDDAVPPLLQHVSWRALPSVRPAADLFLHPAHRGAGNLGCIPQYMYLAPNAIVHRIDKSLPPEIAVMFNPLAPVFAGRSSFPATSAGDTVMILGRGSADWPASWPHAMRGGHHHRYWTGLGRQKLAVARALGADYTIDVDNEDPRERVREITGRKRRGCRCRCHLVRHPTCARGARLRASRRDNRPCRSEGIHHAGRKEASKDGTGLRLPTWLSGRKSPLRVPSVFSAPGYRKAIDLVKAQGSACADAHARFRAGRGGSGDPNTRRPSRRRTVDPLLPHSALVETTALEEATP